MVRGLSKTHRTQWRPPRTESAWQRVELLATGSLDNSFTARGKMALVRTHPAVEGLLRLRGRTGTLYLEREDLLLALFHPEQGKLLKATGLIALTAEFPPKDPESLLPIEINHLHQVEREKGWYHAWLLVAEQLSLSLFALRTLPGKKRLRFLAGEPPEEVRRYGRCGLSLT